MSDLPNKWGLGVELVEGSAGPIHFAGILAAERDLNLGIHVLPDQALLRSLVSSEEAREIRSKVDAAVIQAMADAGLAPDRSRVELVEHSDVADGLIDVVSRTGVDALLIGRRAKRDEDPIVRLGEAARRVLRRLPVTVVVVPPDFGETGDRGLGLGPVIVGVDMSESGATALEFAADLARRLERPLLLAHGTKAFHWGVSYIPPGTMERLQQQTRQGADADLQAWASEHGVEGAGHHVFFGDPAKQLLVLAAEQDAAAIVVGSRKLGPVERVFVSSVSSELAGTAACPVAIVPASED